MRSIPFFNPLDTAKYKNGNGFIDVGAANEGSKLLLYNESPANVFIDFMNGKESILHAWEARYWTLDGDTKQVEWALVVGTSLNVTNPPISLVFGELYDFNEQVEGSYPMALIRQASVGNPGGIQTTGSTGIANDGNGAGTSIVEATVTGQTSSSVSLTNDALFKLSVIITGTLVQVLKTGNADPLLALGAATHLTEVLGNLQVDGNTNLTGTSTLTGAVTATNAGNTIAASSVPVSGIGAGALPGGVTLASGQISGNVAQANVLSGGNNLADGSLGNGATANIIAQNAPGTQYRTPTTNGTIQLQYWNGTSWVTITSFSSAGLVINTGILSADGAKVVSDGNGNITALEFVHAKGTGSATKGLWGQDSAGTPHFIVGINNLDNDTHIQTAPTNKNLKITKSDASADIAIFNDTTGLAMSGLPINTAGLTFAASTGITWKTGDTISGTHTFTGSATGTYTHGANGTPFIVIPTTDVAGSQTTGYDTVTSTQVHITIGAALGFKALTILG